MKPFRTTLFLILFFYLALLVGVSLNYDRANNWMINHPDYLPYFTFIGMGVFLLIFFLTVFERSRYHRKLAKQEAEKNEIKARVYEMQRKNDELDSSIRSFEQSVVRKETPREQSNPNNTL